MSAHSLRPTGATDNAAREQLTPPNAPKVGGHGTGTRAAGRVVVELIDSQPVPVDADRIRRLAARAAESEGAWGDLSVSLVTPEHMAELNARHMGMAGPTDVLAFPIDGKIEVGPAPGGPAPVLGDLVLCPAVAAEQAREGLAPELDLLVTHGVLHLLGYDHDTEAAAELMRRREHELTGRSGAQA